MSRKKFHQPGCRVSYQHRRFLRTHTVTVECRDVTIVDRATTLHLWDGTDRTVKDIYSLEWT